MAAATALRYPGDPTDAEWAPVEPPVPPAKPGGGKRPVLTIQTACGSGQAGQKHRQPMASRSETEVSAAKQAVELVFGILKSVLGFTRFPMRGLGKVKPEWRVPALADNCKRMAKLATVRCKRCAHRKGDDGLTRKIK